MRLEWVIITHSTYLKFKAMGIATRH